MLSFILDHKKFYLAFSFFVAIGLTSLFWVSKGDLVLNVNQFHSSSLDVFFKYLTHLGSGELAAFIAVICLFYRYSYAIIGGASFIISGLIIQLLKRTIFSEYDRPRAFFENLGVDLHFVEGVKVHYHNSFPSGHSASALALVTFLCLVVLKPNWSFMLIPVGFLTAFSRVYLAQHFYMDIVTGSFLGVLISSIVIYVLKEKYKLDDKVTLSGNLLKSGSGEKN